MVSVVGSEAATYSASPVNLATMDCCFARHLGGLPFTCIAMLEMDPRLLL